MQSPKSKFHPNKPQIFSHLSIIQKDKCCIAKAKEEMYCKIFCFQVVTKDSIRGESQANKAAVK